MVPQTLYGMKEPCNCKRMLWSTNAYMECRNPVTVNDCFGSPNLIRNAGTLYHSMTVLVPIPYNECRNLVSV